MRPCLLFLCSIALPIAMMGQQAVVLEQASKGLVKQWEQAYSRLQGGDPANAEEILSQALSAEPGFVDAWFLQADVLAELERVTDAVEALETGLALAPDYRPQAWARLGTLLTEAERYSAAADAWDRYRPQARKDRAESAMAESARLRRMAKAVANPVPFEPVNLGDGVNSADAEYLPSLGIDDSLLIFSRRIGGVNEDFFVSRRGAEGWSVASNLGPPVNTPLNEGAQQLSADGRELYYTVCHAPEGMGSCDLYVALREGEGWSEPRNLGPRVNSSGWDSQPCLSADGQTLYFTSNRPGGKGARDLWMSRRDAAGNWTEPTNLGDSINTAGAEQAPFLHPDGATLYFTSDGHPGLGGSDLFLARLDPTGPWRRPVNLGYPINTPANEGSMVVSADARSAYYASDREDSRGGLDLYVFDLPPSLRPSPVTYVEAVVYDAMTEKPMAATVEVVDLASGKTLDRRGSDPRSGAFLVVLPSGKDYLLHVRRKGYLFHSEHITLPPGQAMEPRHMRIGLLPIIEGGETVLRNVFFASGSATLDDRSRVELDRLATLLREQADLAIRVEGHTDHVGDAEANQRLSEARAKAVQAYLEKAGIEPERLSHAGLGETKPVADNSTEAGRAANRRTAFIVTQAKQP